MTLFLSDPASYDGGELYFEAPLNTVKVKLDAGSAVVYPTGNEAPGFARQARRQVCSHLLDIDGVSGRSAQAGCCRRVSAHAFGKRTSSLIRR